MYYEYEALCGVSADEMRAYGFSLGSMVDIRKHCAIITSHYPGAKTEKGNDNDLSPNDG